MVYSCAYFEQAPSTAYPLEDAQRAKLDLNRCEHCLHQLVELTRRSRPRQVGARWNTQMLCR
jgi:DNA-directed RNA polymerase subunit RPC12/RpoP